MERAQQGTKREIIFAKIAAFHRLKIALSPSAFSIPQPRQRDHTNGCIRSQKYTK